MTLNLAESCQKHQFWRVDHQHTYCVERNTYTYIHTYIRVICIAHINSIESLCASVAKPVSFQRFSFPDNLGTIYVHCTWLALTHYCLLFCCVDSKGNPIASWSTCCYGGGNRPNGTSAACATWSAAWASKGTRHDRRTSSYCLLTRTAQGVWWWQCFCSSWKNWKCRGKFNWSSWKFLADGPVVWNVLTMMMYIRYVYQNS